MAAKRTRKLLVGALCLHTLWVCSQTTFQKTFGGAGNESATWVAEAGNGFILAGHVTNASGNQDALLMRLDASGSAIWQKRFGSGQADAFHSVVATPDGGFLAAGETNSFGAGNTDIFLVKVDAGGAVLWSRTIGNADHDDVAKSIILVPGGGFILSGYSVFHFDTAPNSVFIRLDQNGNAIWSQTYTAGVGNLLLSNYIDGNVIYASGSANGDGAFIRMDLATGSVLTTKAYAGTGADALSYQQPTHDGNMVIADHTWSAQTGTDVEMWVQKVNRNTGQVIWSKVYYHANDNIRGRIEKVNDGGFLLVPYDYNNTAQGDAILAKIDANGNLLWSYNYGGAASDRLMKALQTADGGFIAVGDTRSNNPNANSDILIIKTNSNGRVEGSCAKDANLQSANFMADKLPLETNNVGWSQSTTLNISPLPLNLLSAGFNPNAAPMIERNIALCPNKAINIGGVNHFAPGHIVDTVQSLTGCDTIFSYYLTLSPFNTDIKVIGLCTGETYQHNGIQYTAPATILDTVASTTGNCDTVFSIVLKAWAQPTAEQTISFCSGESVMIDGQLYSQPGTVQTSIPSSIGGCDTLVTYTLLEKPQPVRAATISFCPGESVLIAGNTYSQPGTVLATVPANNGGCDTLVTYTLELRPQPTRSETRSFCPGESVIIAGQVYNQPGSFQLNIPSNTIGCDTLVTYTLELRNQPAIFETRALCPGASVTIAGQTYNQPGTVIANLPSSNGGCDTIATYTLELRDQPTIFETVGFCPGGSVSIAGQVYTQPGTVIANLPSKTGGCDTIATYTLELRNQASIHESRSFCPGQSITIADQTYNQPGTVIVNLPSSNGGCDTVATYTLELLAQPARNEAVGFCPGESVTISGHTYTQPGNVIVNLPSGTGGCDTVVTYTLQHLTPAPSNIAIQCPNDITLVASAGGGAMPAIYAEPVAASDCVCPGLQLTRVNGPASGSMFPVGNTQVCYLAKDNCGQEKPCCFSVKVNEENACDVKVSGPIKYEVLSITKDQKKNYTYRIRVTNNSSEKLVYTAIQIPDGTTTLVPTNNSYYTTSEGRTYLVRNPNYVPMYSIQFRSTTDSISNGKSDVFEYTLPAQTNVTYINITSRLSTKLLYEAHLNTFNCPVGETPNHNGGANERDAVETLGNDNSLLLFPNPTTGVLFTDIADWKGQKLQVNITNDQGQIVHTMRLVAEEELLRVDIPRGLTSGVYFFELTGENGAKEVTRFMLQH